MFKSTVYVYPEFATVMSAIFWFLSAAGSERLPYKEKVVGSNPTGTTSGDW